MSYTADETIILDAALDLLRREYPLNLRLMVLLLVFVLCSARAIV